MNILCVNASLHGAAGNTAKLLDYAVARLDGHTVEVVTLLDSFSPEKLKAKVAWADGLLLFTGAYWLSHSSLLQRFIEEVIDDMDNEDRLLGKVLGVAVTCETSGGQEVAASLMNVFNTMGFLLPPCAYVVISHATQSAWEVDRTVQGWDYEDLDVMLANFVKAGALRVDWRNWESPDKSSLPFLN